MGWRRRRAVPLLLVAATLVPIAALGWLGARILEQDRAIDRQRQIEALTLKGGRLALAIEDKLASIEDELASGGGIQFTHDGLGSGVLYQPDTAPEGTRLPAEFAVGEELEFRRNDLPGAARKYSQLAASADPSVRAEALVRLGRVLRKQENREGALRVCAKLQELGSVPVAGQPAEMVARQVRYRLSGALEDRDEFAKALYCGVAKMDAATFRFYREMLRDWGGPGPPPDAVERTEALLALWRRWNSGDLPARGREFAGNGGERVLAIWTGGSNELAARVLTVRELEGIMSPLARDEGVKASLAGAPAEQNAVVLTQGETRLPFELRVTATDRDGEFGSGRRLLVAGLALTFVLMLAAAYGLYRATSRELALAAQQADFVSAVSHEFRTPLTSMRHLTELLTSDNVPGEERKARYYQLLARETERLHNMVESLLSFGRMQAGSYAWRLEPVDSGELVRGVVEEFRGQPQSRGRSVTCDAEDDLPTIQADREALVRAVSNLLDNAGKYSESDAPIRVSVRRSGDSVYISVQDRGAGIPRDQQAKLFDRFVRGDAARRAGVRGIGVGLALVKSVAEAHGGSVRVASEPGQGSTFTLVIPCHES